MKEAISSYYDSQTSTKLPYSTSAHSRVTAWLESVTGCKRRRHSDSFLYHPGEGHMATPLEVSASEPVYRINTNTASSLHRSVLSLSSAGYIERGSESNATFSTRAATTYRSDTYRTATKSGVKSPHYIRILHENNIHLLSRTRAEKRPDHVENILALVCADRTNELDQGQLSTQQDRSLEVLIEGADERKVVNYFQKYVFPINHENTEYVLSCSENKKIDEVHLPNIQGAEQISVPHPDLLYGYRFGTSLPLPLEKRLSANNDTLILPFFSIDYKGDHSGNTGSMWTAAKQCLGSTACAINIVEKFNLELKQRNSKQDLLINSTVFSIAMNGSEARLYVSWLHDDAEYYTDNFECLALQNRDHYSRFCRYVNNIIDWGRDQRFKEIQRAINFLCSEPNNQQPEPPIHQHPTPPSRPSKRGRYN